VLALLAGGRLYLAHQLKQDHVSLPHTVPRGVPAIPKTEPGSAPAAGAARASGAAGQHAVVGRCGAIAVNEHASCGFAANVVRAYEAHPASEVVAHSPVTHLTYTVDCRRIGETVTCVGGTDDNASIAFRSPAAS
jgi:hypothetical protein